MKRVDFLLRKCSLQGCERPGAFVTAKGQTVCEWHRKLLIASAMQLAHENMRIEKEESSVDLGEVLDGGIVPPGDEE